MLNKCQQLAAVVTVIITAVTMDIQEEIRPVQGKRSTSQPSCGLQNSYS